MPSSFCGTHSPRLDSNRKKWQNLWIVLPRKRKYQSMTRMGPYQVLEPGLLGHFAARGVGGGLAGFEVALGESPVAIGVADQEEPLLAARSAPEYDPARRGLALGPPLAS